MRIYRFSIILFLGVILTPSIATYTSEENTDSSKTIYGAVNSLLAGSETSHTQSKHSYDNPPSIASYGSVPGNYFNGPTGLETNSNLPCSAETGCPLPPRRHSGTKDFVFNIGEQRPQNANEDIPANNGAGLIDVRGESNSRGNELYYQRRPQNVDIDYPAANVAGQIYVRADQNAGSNGLYYPPYPQQYPQPYPPSQGYYPSAQVDPGFSRFPTPQQGGPMPNYFPYPQSSYPVLPQGPHSENFGPYLPEPHHQHHGHRHHHHHDHDGDHSFRNHDHHHRPHDHDNDYRHHGHDRGNRYRNYDDSPPNSGGYNTLDHSLKTNTEYTEVGHHENTFQGNSNGFGYGAFTRPPY